MTQCLQVWLDPGQVDVPAEEHHIYRTAALFRLSEAVNLHFQSLVKPGASSGGRGRIRSF